MSEGARRRYLLDTHTLIWALREPERLSSAARAALLTGELSLSVVSYWEAMIKSMKGGIDLGNPRTWWARAVEQLGASTLLLHPEHVAALSSLPPIHKDPFDRILIAQATVEGLALISADGNIARYASQSLQVIV